MKLVGIIAVLVLLGVVVYFNQGGNAPSNNTMNAPSSGASADARPLASGSERHVSKMPLAIRMLSAGVNHTCAIDFSRKVFCWGGANKGSLGDDGIQRRCEEEDGVQGAICEYRNASMQTTHYSFTPVNVLKGQAPSQSDFLSDATYIATGDLFACAVIGDEKNVYCWGKGSSGQLGNGERKDQKTPVAVCAPGYSNDCAKNPLKGVTALAAGNEHICAIVGKDSNVYCWGNGANGRLGNMKSDVQSTPQIVCNVNADDCDANPLKDVKILTAGNYLTCAAYGENRAGVCWGDGSSNQLGNNNQDSNQAIPTPICAPGASDCTESPFIKVHSLAIGQSHTCAVAGDNKTAYCWGQARYGQLGNNDDLDNQKTPSAVCIPGLSDNERDWECRNDPSKILTNVQTIATGYVHTCASVGGERQVYCWGESFFGRLGDNGQHNMNIPSKVYNGYDKDGYAIEDAENLWLDSAKSLSLGSNYSCAIVEDEYGSDTGKCWGNNQLGQLGNKERVNMLIPSIVGF